jgi:signal transduction histidine kinase
VTIRVLNLEDVATDSELVVRELKRAGLDFTLQRVSGRESFEAALRAPAAPPDVIISDHNVPQFDGRAALQLARRLVPGTPFILFTGSLNEEKAVEYMKAGADDYILKDRMARLGPAVQDALQRKRERLERRRLEEQLLQAQKMEAIGQLAGGVAHDFNNILTAIIGTADLMLADLPAESPHRADAVEILDAAQRAAGLTRQLLAFSRKRAGETRPVDLNALVRGLQTMLRRLLDATIELSLQLDDGLAGTVADAGQIEQVLLNLAVNARDAMPRGGRLTVQTANAELDRNYCDQHPGVKPGPYVMISVSDTGIGMDTPTQARVFQPFFTTKEPGKGTGLGLSTVDTIIKQHGGHVGLYSEIGRGTVFKVYLPRAAPLEDVSSSEAVRAMMPRGTETVLVVEDTNAVRSLVARVLEGLGYEVLEATDAATADVAAARHTGPIHLLLSDVVLPGATGPDLARRLAEQRAAMRVLFTSGYAADSVVHQGLLPSGAPYLQKPFTPDILARKVREVLD